MEEKKKFSFNIIDVIAVLLILAVVIYAGVRHFSGKGSGAQVEKVDITYVVKAECVPTELYESSKAQLPCKLMASGAWLPATIESVECRPYLALSGDGQWVEDPDHVNLYFTVTGKVDKTAVMLSRIGEQEIRVGKPHLLKSEWIELYNTVIVDVKWGE